MEKLVCDSNFFFKTMEKQLFVIFSPNSYNPKVLLVLF